MGGGGGVVCIANFWVSPKRKRSTRHWTVDPTATHNKY